MGDALEDDVPSVAVGDVIGEKYRIESLIGSGAMGTVYRAHDLPRQSKVAIKVLRPERLHDDNAQRRFSREARATSSLQSPHAIRTFEIERLPSGVPYIVMEYLEGQDLAAKINERGPLPVAEAVRYVIDACDAVGEAHRFSIIHRDIKPANLFVTRAGVLKVLDFGLAKNLPALLPDAGSEATKTNFLLGSPHYMSPEQLRSAKEVDARADIWSLGATLFTLLCGDPPFFGTNLFVLIALILNDDAPRLDAKLPRAPKALAAVVARCLRRDREDRYASCEALAQALEDALAGVPAAELEDPTWQLDARASLTRRRAATTLGTDEASSEGFSSTMDAAVPTVPRPAIKVRGDEPMASFADPVDDIDPTALAESPFESPPASAPPSAVPKLYDDEPAVERGEKAGTMLMPQTLDRLLAKAPGGIPRVYDDDVDLLPDMTKLMLESPYRPAPAPAVADAPAHWSAEPNPPPFAPISPPPAAPPPGLVRPVVAIVAALALLLLAIGVLVRCS